MNEWMSLFFVAVFLLLERSAASALPLVRGEKPKLQYIIIILIRRLRQSEELTYFYVSSISQFSLY